MYSSFLWVSSCLWIAVMLDLTSVSSHLSWLRALLHFSFSCCRFCSQSFISSLCLSSSLSLSAFIFFISSLRLIVSIFRLFISLTSSAIKAELQFSSLSSSLFSSLFSPSWHDSNFSSLLPWLSLTCLYSHVFVFAMFSQLSGHAFSMWRNDPQDLHVIIWPSGPVGLIFFLTPFLLKLDANSVRWLPLFRVYASPAFQRLHVHDVCLPPPTS